MKKQWLCALIVGVSLLSGCASLKPLPPLSAASTQQVWSQFWNRQEKLFAETRRIQGKIDLDITENSRSVSGKGNFYSTPKGLRLELRDVLGRVQFEVGLSENKKFTAYYPSKNIAYLDTKNGVNYLRDFLNLEMNFKELKDLWLGILPFQKSETKLISVTHAEEPGKYLLIFNRGESRFEAWLEAGTSALLKLKWKTSNGGAEFEYSHFAPCCRESSTERLPSLAREVLLKNGDEKSEIDLEWNEIVPVQEKNKHVFDLELPVKVRQVLLN